MMIAKTLLHALEESHLEASGRNLFTMLAKKWSRGKEGGTVERKFDSGHKRVTISLRFGNRDLLSSCNFSRHEQSTFDSGKNETYRSHPNHWKDETSRGKQVPVCNASWQLVKSTTRPNLFSTVPSTAGCRKIGYHWKRGMRLLLSGSKRMFAKSFAAATRRACLDDRSKHSIQNEATSSKGS